MKSPAQQWGGFIVDGIEYPSTDTVAFWWGRNSNHLIEATTPDINGDSTEAYAFSHWSDGGENPHWVEASASFVLCAYYTHQYRVDITKDPPRDFGYLWVDSTFIFDDEYHDWWDEGSVHSIAVSTPDLSTRVRYYLSHWSDGDTAYMRDVGPVDSVVNLVAYYDARVRVAVTKDPAESYGYIEINDSTYEGVASATQWIDMGDSATVSVSAVDIHEGTDSAYTFSHWNDDTTDTLRPKELGALTDGVDLVAHYDAGIYNLEFSVSPTVWDLDTLDREYTRTMYPYEVITLTNTGTIPIDYGLQTVEDLTSWTAGYSAGYNTYVLRAEFDQNSLPPVSFQPAYDYVKTTIQWSDSRFFGPMGYYVAPGEWLHLWLQFITPTGTFDYSRQTIILRVWARPTIY
ncbi:MAG TPA: hypothetical protein ENG11_06230 [candidate division Zixibacteria bacterium]|nr:hypothetical protein [candidate division Zixibacteria bacterium]